MFDRSKIYLDRWVIGPDGKPTSVRCQRVTGDDDQVTYYSPEAPSWLHPEPASYPEKDTASTKKGVEEIIDRKNAEIQEAQRRQLEELEEYYGGVMFQAPVLKQMYLPHRIHGTFAEFNRLLHGLVIDLPATEILLRQQDAYHQWARKRLALVDAFNSLPPYFLRKRDDG
jgi:hypothetical protein